MLLQPEGDGPGPAPGRLRALVDPGSTMPLDAWISRYTFAEDVRLTPAPDLAALRVIGAEAIALAPALIERPGDMATSGAGSRRILWSRRDFGSVPSALITGAREDLGDILRRVSADGALSSEQALQWRVEAGEPGGGTEITEDRFPLEAGLLHEISFTKGCYIGQEVVARQDAYGKVVRRLARLAFATKPSAGDLVLSQGREVGRLTSVAPSAIALDGAPAYLALGFIPAKLADAGTSIPFSSGLAGTVL